MYSMLGSGSRLRYGYNRQAFIIFVHAWMVLRIWYIQFSSAVSEIITHFQSRIVQLKDVICGNCSMVWLVGNVLYTRHNKTRYCNAEIMLSYLRTTFHLNWLLPFGIFHHLLVRKLVIVLLCSCLSLWFMELCAVVAYCCWCEHRLLRSMPWALAILWEI